MLYRQWLKRGVVCRRALVRVTRHQHFIHPLTLFGQEPGGGAIAFSILHIPRGVGDIPVAADDELPSLVAHLLQVAAQQLEKFVLALLLPGVTLTGASGRQYWR